MEHHLLPEKCWWHYKAPNLSNKTNLHLICMTPSILAAAPLHRDSEVVSVSTEAVHQSMHWVGEKKKKLTQASCQQMARLRALYEGFPMISSTIFTCMMITLYYPPFGGAFANVSHHFSSLEFQPDIISYTPGTGFPNDLTASAWVQLQERKRDYNGRSLTWHQ